MRRAAALRGPGESAIRAAEEASEQERQTGDREEGGGIRDQIGVKWIGDTANAAPTVVITSSSRDSLLTKQLPQGSRMATCQKLCRMFLGSDR